MPKEDKDDSTKIIHTPPKPLVLACQQIVNCLIENVLQLEENTESESKYSTVLVFHTIKRFVEVQETTGYVYIHIHEQLYLIYLCIFESQYHWYTK